MRTKDYDDLTFEELQRLSKKWLKWHPDKRDKVAKALNRKPSYVARMTREFRKIERKRLAHETARPQPEDDPDDVMIEIAGHEPAFEVATYNTPLTVASDNCVVTSDWHLPRFHWRLWLASLFVARAIEADSYFALGDLRDNNQAGVTAWPRSWHVPEVTGDEVQNQLLYVMDRTQSGSRCQVYTCDGNHDEWPEKNLGGQYWFYRCLQNIPNVTSTRLQYINLETKKGAWRLTHPKNSSMNLLTVPRNLHMRRHLDKSVACAHTHKLGLGVCTGDYWVMETGGLFWREAMQYTSQKDSTYEPAAPGFAFIVDGDPYIISEHHSLKWVLGSRLNQQYEKRWAEMQKKLSGYYKPVSHIVSGNKKAA